ncbi:type VI secretion system protein TssA [Desulfoluna sp.]|uniref:type VI secretion system protein TssA n=1 Tax=Desulfoluna sp. TaxID=2045199 RepID=UPI0026299DF4|nr:type VI secretion system protein TssA [Desulfoluna sp.]
MLSSSALLGKEPICEAFPAGQDVRYEVGFECLQEELDKLSSPVTRETFQWDTVAALSIEILKTKSKDILVASYLCVALVKLKGWPGLETSTAIYSDLLETYWENLFPPMRRMGGRLSAVQWWMEKMSEALSDEMEGIPDESMSRQILENLGRIDAFIKAHTELDLSLVALRQQIEGLPLRKAQAGIQDDKPGEQKVFDPEFTTAVTLDAGNLMRSLAPVFKNIKAASRMVRDDGTHNPQSYRWLRFAVWEPVKALPPAIKGVTKIPAPPQQVTAPLRQMMVDEAWEALLLHSESQLYNPQNTFLFSLNYYSAEALCQLGKKYTGAHEMVCRETRLFFQRLPGIEALRFADGTPFACEETLAWAVRMTSLKEGQEETFDQAPVDEGSLADVIKSARTLVRQGIDLNEAVDGLQQKIRASVSGKEALGLRLGLISLLADYRHEKIAVVHVEKVFHDMARFNLIRWDPPLALNGLKVMYKVMKKLPGKVPASRAAEILAMIAETSTVEAIKLHKI